MNEDNVILINGRYHGRKLIVSAPLPTLLHVLDSGDLAIVLTAQERPSPDTYAKTGRLMDDGLAIYQLWR